MHRFEKADPATSAGRREVRLSHTLRLRPRMADAPPPPRSQRQDAPLAPPPPPPPPPPDAKQRDAKQRAREMRPRPVDPRKHAKLLEAAKEGETDELIELLDAGVPADAADEFGCTALYLSLIHI